MTTTDTTAVAGTPATRVQLLAYILQTIVEHSLPEPSSINLPTEASPSLAIYFDQPGEKNLWIDHLARELNAEPSRAGHFRDWHGRTVILLNHTPAVKPTVVDDTTRQLADDLISRVTP